MRSRRMLVIGVCIYSSLVAWSQTADGSTTSQTDPVQSQSSNVNPSRIVESHTQSGNRTTDHQSLQQRNSDGNFEPYQDIEKETVKVNAATTRTITRTYGRDSDGHRSLVQVTEEEMHTSPGGDSRVVRSTSNPDANGNLQEIQRQIEETKKLGKDVEETKTTVMLPGGNGELAPAMQTEERRQKQSDDTINSTKTSLLPDVNGNWQVGEVQHTRIQQDGKTRTTNESVSRPDDLDGSLGEISHTVSTESETAPGASQKTVDTYSVDVPGTPRDGDLHPVQRKTTTQRTDAIGRQTTVEQVEKANPGDPGSDLKVMTVVIDTKNPTSSGTRGTRTIEARSADDTIGTVSVDTTKTDKNPAIQVQIAPAPAPK